MKSYDVIIVGAGPAGIFAALELSGHGLKVAVVEKGPELEKRKCPLEIGGNCTVCKSCSIISGWGGAGAFSDGKLTLSPEVGGWLPEYLSPQTLNELIQYVDNIYLKYGAPEGVYGGTDEEIETLQRKATLAELHFVPSKVRHLGTGYSQIVLQAMRDDLEARKVDIFTRRKVDRILVEDRRFVGVEINGDVMCAGACVVAPGREGAEWLSDEAKRLKLSYSVNPVDLGVRVELPAVVTESLTEHLYESKLIYHSRSFDDKVRTFCVCPNGEVTIENNDGLLTVNGHSHAHRKTQNTNFALLVSKTFTEPFKEPIAYGKHIARLANLLGGGVIVQKLGDLLEGRRSTPDRIRKGLVRPTLTDATPGDLSLVLPYRYLVDIKEMLEALDKIAPGVCSRHTLLYGVEVKFYSSRLKLSRELETEVKNLYAAGDGAGITRGLMQASISGVVAARSILGKSQGNQ